MEPAPAATKNDHETERYADGLVQIHVPAARRGPCRNLLQGPAKRNLHENDERDQPMQRNCGPRVADSDLARMSLVLRLQVRPSLSPCGLQSGPSARATGSRKASGPVPSAARAPLPSGQASR